MRWSILALVPATALGLSSLAAAPQVLRQDDNPAHPAAFHTGSCDSPSDEAAYTLATVGPQENDEGEPVAAADTLGQLTTSPVLSGAGLIDAPLESLVDEGNPYVLVVHESEQEMDSLLACGEVAGPVVDGQITLALRPLNDSDYAGLAVLGTTEDDGTGGTVLLFADVDAFDSDDSDDGGDDSEGDGSGGRDRQPRDNNGRSSGGVGTGDQPPSGGISDDDTDDDGDTDGDTDGPRRTRTPRTRTPGTETPGAETPGAETPTAPAATSTAPAATEPPATEPPATEPPATEPPATEPPATEPPATEPPPTEPPAPDPTAEPTADV